SQSSARPTGPSPDVAQSCWRTILIANRSAGEGMCRDCLCMSHPFGQRNALLPVAPSVVRYLLCCKSLKTLNPPQRVQYRVIDNNVILSIIIDMPARLSSYRTGQALGGLHEADAAKSGSGTGPR